MNREQRAKIATAMQLHVSICRFEAQVIVFFCTPFECFRASLTRGISSRSSVHSTRVLQSIIDAGNFFTQFGALYHSASEHLVQPFKMTTVPPFAFSGEETPSLEAIVPFSPTLKAVAATQPWWLLEVARFLDIRGAPILTLTRIPPSIWSRTMTVPVQHATSIRPDDA